MTAKVSRCVPPRSAGSSSQHKRMVLEVDLNIPLFDPSHSNEVGAPTHTPAVIDVQAGQQRASPSPVTIDVDSIDDDVVLSSPRAFAEAKNNSRRGRSRRNVVDVELESANRVANIRTKRRRVPPNQPIINCELYPILEMNGNSANGYDRSMAGLTRIFIAQPPPPSPPPPPPPEPAFSCPVCMGPLVEEMSTKCGHIFCKACIQTAIAVQGKCPTCRRKTTLKDTLRIYLPKTS